MQNSLDLRFTAATELQSMFNIYFLFLFFFCISSMFWKGASLAQCVLSYCIRLFMSRQQSFFFFFSYIFLRLSLAPGLLSTELIHKFKQTCPASKSCARTAKLQTGFKPMAERQVLLPLLLAVIIKLKKKTHTMWLLFILSAAG